MHALVRVKGDPGFLPGKKFEFLKMQEKPSNTILYLFVGL